MMNGFRHISEIVTIQSCKRDSSSVKHVNVVLVD